MSKVIGAAVLILAFCVNASAQTKAADCTLGRALKRTYECTRSSLRIFSQQAGETARSVADVSYDYCGWDAVYANFDVKFRESISKPEFRDQHIREFTVMVFELRSPPTEPRPALDVYDKTIAALETPECQQP